MTTTEKEERQFCRMTKTPVPKLVSSLALPTVVSMLVTSLYNMADTYFVSQLGTDASAAVGIVFSIQALIQAVGFGLGMGAGSIISRLLGQKDADTASKYASSAFAAALGFGVVLMILGFSDLHGVMSLFGADADVLPYACDYGSFILAGAPLMCASFVLNNTLRAEGRASFSMVGLTAGGVINIFLDPIFIYDWGFGLNTAGAAIATMISQGVSFFILLSFFLRGKSIIRLSLRRASRRTKDYLEIIKSGAPTICRQGISSLSTTLLNNAVRPFGSAAIAAVSISSKIYMVVRNIVVGIGQGFQPVAGYNYGAKNYLRVKKAFWFTVGLGTAVCVVFSLGVLGFSQPLMALFRRDDSRVIQLGSRALLYFAAVMPLMGYSTYVNQMLQCLGRVRSATFLACCRNGVMFVPTLMALAHLGLEGLIMTQPIADLLTCVVSVPFQVIFFKKLRAACPQPKELS